MNPNQLALLRLLADIALDVLPNDSNRYRQVFQALEHVDAEMDPWVPTPKGQDRA